MTARRRVSSQPLSRSARPSGRRWRHGAETEFRQPGGYAIPRDAAGEVAVVSTPRGLFLPDGGQEDSETPQHAALREAYEECGLRIRVSSRVDTADELLYAEDEGTYYRKRCAFFSADVVREG